MIIAVDGPAAAGKGTLARRLARELDLAYLDTGLIYRAVAARLLDEGGDGEDVARATAIAEALAAEDLERGDLRSEAVAAASSQVAAIPAVRTALRAFQQRFATTPPDGKAGAVLDGRDIGTVVCPDATVKFFVTADLEARARRRHKELLDRGETSIYARVLQEMRVRDARDSERAASPLRPADDAIVIDTSKMAPDAVFAAALDSVKARVGMDS